MDGCAVPCRALPLRTPPRWTGVRAVTRTEAFRESWWGGVPRSPPGLPQFRANWSVGRWAGRCGACPSRRFRLGRLHYSRVEELAKYPLNGREIKNALRLALALAAEEECTLTHELLLDTSAMVKPVSDSCDINTHPLSSGTNNRRHFVLRLLLGLVLPLLIAMMYELFIVQRDDLLNDFSENNNIDRKNFRLFSWFKRDGAFASLSRQQ